MQLSNSKVIENFFKIKFSAFILPLLLLLSIVVFLMFHNAVSVKNYLEIQKNYFYLINSKLSQYPSIIYNLTQLGDALIVLSILTVIFLKTPKVWEALLTASIISAVVSNILKSFFAVTRPAATYETSSFTIIGKTLTGHNSLPSGHSITVFTTICILLFAFMPKKNNLKLFWIILLLGFGLLLVFTRVGVGAHHPLDVIIGGIIGYICGIIGIILVTKYNIFTWINNRKFYPIFVLLFLVCSGVIVNKIIHENLFIYYLALFCNIYSLYKVIYVYTKK